MNTSKPSKQEEPARIGYFLNYVMAFKWNCWKFGEWSDGPKSALSARGRAVFSRPFQDSHVLPGASALRM